MLEKEIIELEQHNCFLQTFKDKFMQSEDDIKVLEKKIFNLENEKVKLIKLLSDYENLRRENQLF